MPKHICTWIPFVKASGLSCQRVAVVYRKHVNANYSRLENRFILRQRKRQPCVYAARSQLEQIALSHFILILWHFMSLHSSALRPTPAFPRITFHLKSNLIWWLCQCRRYILIFSRYFVRFIEPSNSGQYIPSLISLAVMVNCACDRTSSRIKEPLLQFNLIAQVYYIHFDSFVLFAISFDFQAHTNTAHKYAENPEAQCLQTMPHSQRIWSNVVCRILLICFSLTMILFYSHAANILTFQHCRFTRTNRDANAHTLPAIFHLKVAPSIFERDGENIR